MSPNKSCLLKVVVIHVWVYLRLTIIFFIDVYFEQNEIFWTIIPSAVWCGVTKIKWFGSCVWAVEGSENINFNFNLKLTFNSVLSRPRQTPSGCKKSGVRFYDLGQGELVGGRKWIKLINKVNQSKILSMHNSLTNKIQRRTADEAYYQCEKFPVG